MIDVTGVFVAGHHGMVGSAIARRLQKNTGIRLVTRSRDELDLRDSEAVLKLLRDESVHEIYLCAAKVGGVHANRKYTAEFIHENLQIQTSVIHAAYQANVEKLLFLGSSCIYPRDAEQPMSEEALMTGVLEKTNEAYAVAKIAGIKMCEAYRRQYCSDFRSVMPTNLYGSNDNFSLRNSHVLPALLRKAHEAKLTGASSLSVWGSGKPRREFLHVDDLASACEFVMSKSEDEYWSAVGSHCSHLNVGCGEDLTIKALAEAVCEVVGFNGDLVFDSSMPDGTPRKLLDSSKIGSMGWAPEVTFNEGLLRTYHWMVEHWDEVNSD